MYMYTCTVNDKYSYISLHILKHTSSIIFALNSQINPTSESTNQDFFVGKKQGITG